MYDPLTKPNGDPEPEPDDENIEDGGKGDEPDEPENE